MLIKQSDLRAVLTNKLCGEGKFLVLPDSVVLKRF
ncbi:MAG: hypothetical protein C5S47_07525 [Candidatus Methanogasteraceae archaeon]|nr:MAG: hypothetical protein C5S47_07525 [ANME-2 cluster archaeon]